MLEHLNNWALFSILFGLLLLVTFIMMLQSRNFYTRDVIDRKFNMMELEVPAAPKELVNIIRGLFLLDKPKSEKSIAALKGNLILDFVFMPLAYGSIFLLCWRVAAKMYPTLGYYVFMAFAFLQIVPWICDIIENIYLLTKLKEGLAVKETNEKKHRAYLFMEALKWGIALTATTCAASAVCYFWLTGNYSRTSFNHMIIVLIEMAAFWLIAKKVAQKRRIEKQ